MPTNYNANPNEAAANRNDVVLALPVDGEARSAASVASPFQALANLLQRVQKKGGFTDLVNTWVRQIVQASGALADPDLDFPGLPVSGSTDRRQIIRIAMIGGYYARMFQTLSGSYSITINAGWNGTGWARDVAGITPTRYVFNSSGLTVQAYTGGNATWTDTEFQAAGLSLSPTATDLGVAFTPARQFVHYVPMFEFSSPSPSLAPRSIYSNGTAPFFYLSTSTTTGLTLLWHRLRLPRGATITKFEVLAYNNDSSSRAITVQLACDRYTAYTGSFGQYGFEQDGFTGSATVVNGSGVLWRDAGIVADSTTNASGGAPVNTVPEDGWMRVVLSLPQTTSNDQVAIAAARATYTLSNLKPA